MPLKAYVTYPCGVPSLKVWAVQLYAVRVFAVICALFGHEDMGRIVEQENIYPGRSDIMVKAENRYAIQSHGGNQNAFIPLVAHRDSDINTFFLSDA